MDDKKLNYFRDSILQVRNILDDIEKEILELEVNGLKNDITKVKTNNQLRKEIIKEAKEFVNLDKYRESNGHLKIKDSRGDLYYADWYTDNVDFKYDYKKREVSLRIKGDNEYNSNTVFDRHIVKFHPDDVFNVHIGKAIVLGRALGLDVSKFESAVQPDEFTVGQYATENLYNEYGFTVTSIINTNDLKENKSQVIYSKDRYDLDCNLKIYGDAYAKY